MARSTADAHDGSPRLSTAAYAILGLLEQSGAQTTYDLKRYIDNSIGYFWPFPHSQLYAETRRLEQLGFVESDKEPSGRRRKILSVTDAGRIELESWKAETHHGSTEIRDIGLLRLFLSDTDAPERIAELAEQQRLLHIDKLTEYEELAGRLGEHSTPSTTTLRLGLAFERAAIEFWEAVGREHGAI